MAMAAFFDDVEAVQPICWRRDGAHVEILDRLTKDDA